MSGWQYGIRTTDGSITWLAANEEAAREETAAINAEAERPDVEAIRRFVGDWQPIDPPVEGESATSWHDLRLYLGPDLLDPGETTLVAIGHPEECRALPEGAVCWVAHTPLHESWPTEIGRYRIRLIDYVDGGDECGPNIVTALEVEPVPGEPASP